MTDTDKLSTRKVWFAEYCPNVTIAGEVPNGVKDLPSALISWMLCVGEILSVLMYFLLTTEREVAESNDKCVWWLLIVPVMYAGMCCVVQVLITIGVHTQLAWLGCLLGCCWFLQLCTRCPLFPHSKQVTVTGGALSHLQSLVTRPDFPQLKHWSGSWRWVLKASSCSETSCNVASILFKQVSSSVWLNGFTDSVVLVLLYVYQAKFSCFGYCFHKIGLW